MTINVNEYELFADKNDFISQCLYRLFKKNILVITVCYWIISFGGIMLLGFITGQLGNTQYSPVMKRDYSNLINMGLVAPVGIFILLMLYKKLNRLFIVLKQRHILKESDETLLELKNKIQRIYQCKAVTVFSLAVSVSINIYIAFNKSNEWNGAFGGITAWYFRFFVIINFYYIWLILYKCVVTVVLMRKIFSMKFRLDPIHPDNCGGLRPIGELALSLNYFAGLILLYMLVLVFLDPYSKANSMFYFGFFIVVIINFIILFLGLSKAHDKMKMEKEIFLNYLHKSFQKNYVTFHDKLQENVFDIELSSKIASIEKMFQMSKNMPVWPFNLNIMSRLISTTVIPIFILLYQEFLSSVVNKIVLFFNM